MLFRAIFWIGLVSVMMPHEPDLGYGRPGPGAALTDTLLGWVQARVAGDPAAKSVSATTADAAVFTVGSRVRSLAEVKAEIAAARQENIWN